MVQRIPGDLVDHPDVHPARPVPFFQYDPPDQVLRHPRHAPAISLAQLPGDAALAGTGVTAQHDETSVTGPERHAADPKQVLDRRLSRHAVWRLSSSC